MELRLTLFSRADDSRNAAFHELATDCPASVLTTLWKQTTKRLKLNDLNRKVQYGVFLGLA